MIIAIVGLSGTGKDTVAKHIKKRYGIDMIVSYATRPMRDYETNGKEHWFITKEEMQKLKETEELIAYTINEETGIEYCATKSQVENKNIVYIIDPKGIYWLRENAPDVELLSIYLSVPMEELKERLKNRGDNEETFNRRLETEYQQFFEFEENKRYDEIVRNTGTQEELFAQIDAILDSWFYLV